MREMMSVILEGSLDGEMELDVPCDRNEEFEPKIVKNYQNTLTQDVEEKNHINVYKRMTTGDIESHIQELYGVDISDSTISRITDKTLPIVKEWQDQGSKLLKGSFT